MLCSWRTYDLAVLLIWMVFVADSRSSCVDEKQRTQNNSLPPTEVNTTVSVQSGTKAVLCCPLVSLAKVVLVTWKLFPRGMPYCTISYNAETEKVNSTCTDRRIALTFTPDWGPHLQIDAVTIDHDGYYLCEIVTPDGNFHHGHDLQLLVPPEVTLSGEKNRTAVCKAAAGKPAAQIFWIPEGNCVTKNESDVSGTVTVRSACHWEPNSDSVSVVTCLVLHLTGNKNLSITWNPDSHKLIHGLYAIIPFIIVVSILLWKINGFRKCKLEKPEATPVVEEDEMQPYASYAEKSNPLYDTGYNMKTPQLSHSEVDGTGLHT